MAKKRKKRPKTSQEQAHPTMFVFDGDIKCYDHGSMLALSMQISADEWQQIIKETVEYKIFIDCLKETAFPILAEEWTKVDEWYLVQLDVAISRMRNIDPLLVAQINTEQLRKLYTDKMKISASDLQQTIKTIKCSQQELNSQLKQLHISDL